MKQFFSASLLLFMATAACAQNEDVPPPPPPPPKVEATVDTNLPDDYGDFLKRNPSVKRINWNKNQVIISFRDGKEERFARTAAGAKEAETKYGKLPVAPPPPPPPPSAPPPPPPPPVKAMKPIPPPPPSQK